MRDNAYLPEVLRDINEIIYIKELTYTYMRYNWYLINVKFFSHSNSS